MNLIIIISEWENNALPNELEKLEAYKVIIDRCESFAFEAWRNATNKTLAAMLTNEQLIYSDVSHSILRAIATIKNQQIISAIKNGKSTPYYNFQY